MPTAQSRTYRQHHPEETPLYALIQQHLPSFLERAKTEYRGGLPKYVKEEFNAYSKCGVHAHGFAHARCHSCGAMLLVAFSCKKRGICPSCNARRMADTAARLVDRVLPDVRLRQWVLSVPFELRLLLARKPAALSAVGRIFIEEVFRWQRTIGIRLGLATTAAAKEKLRGGAICFPQRFGGSLNLNVHFHVIIPDALFCRGASGKLEMEVLRKPNRSELEDITYNVSTRCLQWLRKNGHLQEEHSSEDPTLLERCMNGSLGLGALALLSMKGEVRRLSSAHSDSVSHKVRGGSFNIHVGDPAYGKEEREHLIRYCARAPLSLERLSVSEDGKVVYQLKRPIRGCTHRVMEPHQFLARLCALIPPPRHPLLRFHGVFGPASKWRSEVVPNPSNALPNPTEVGADVDEEAAAHAVESRWQSQRLDWATLLHRVYDIDALRCECGGEIRFEELIESPKDAKAFLALHEIQSPRRVDAKVHVRPWSDAPNVALAFGEFTTAQDADPEAQPTAPLDPASVDEKDDPPLSSDDSHLHYDELPPEDHYFMDEVPPD